MITKIKVTNQCGDITEIASTDASWLINFSQDTWYLANDVKGARLDGRFIEIIMNDDKTYLYEHGLTGEVSLSLITA